jgi:hypothetical protein
VAVWLSLLLLFGIQQASPCRLGLRAGTNLNIALPVIVIIFCLTTLGTLISLLSLSADNRRMNRQIKDGQGLHPDDARNLSSLGGQLVLINLINVIAGAAAGVGASLFVDGDRLRWPPTGWAGALIVAALVAAEITGIFVVRYTTRPTRAWITDTSIFRTYLTRISRSGPVDDGEMEEILASRDEWLSRTIVRPLRSRSELQRLGLELKSARQEWISTEPIDRAAFGNQLISEVSRKQVHLWIKHKRRWRLAILPAGSAASLTASIIIELWVAASSRFLLVIISLVTGLLWGAALYRVTFPVARRDLIMTNRYVALERMQLNACQRLIQRIEEARESEDSGLRLKTSGHGRLVMRIGTWDLYRGMPEASREPTNPNSS